MTGERHDPETHLIPLALDAALGRRVSFSLFGSDYPTADCSCVRDYIHITDLAHAHLLALDALTLGQHRIYNLGNGIGFSNLQVVQAIREVTGDRSRSRSPTAAPATRRPCTRPRRGHTANWDGCH